MNEHERYEIACRFCLERFSARQLKDAVAKVEGHERECPQGKKA